MNQQFTPGLLGIVVLAGLTGFCSLPKKSQSQGQQTSRGKIVGAQPSVDLGQLITIMRTITALSVRRPPCFRLDRESMD
jgi:hypothetical protein